MYFVNMPGILALSMHHDASLELANFIHTPVTLEECKNTLHKIAAAFISYDLQVEDLEHVEGYQFRLEGY